MAQLGSNSVFPEAAYSINSEEEKRLDIKPIDINDVLRHIKFEDEKSESDYGLAL